MKRNTRTKAITFAAMSMMAISLIGCGVRGDVSEIASEEESVAVVEETEDAATEASTIEIAAVENEYFPSSSEGNISYSVIKLFEEDATSVPVNIKKLETYESGNVYRITMRYKDVPGRYYWGVTDRYNIGTFLVTEDKIYLLSEREDTPTEEEFLTSGIVVCSNENSEQNINGDEIRIINDGNECLCSRSNTLTESGFYSTYAWVKGQGLVYFKSGYGAEGDPIEIALEDYVTEAAANKSSRGFVEMMDGDALTEEELEQFRAFLSTVDNYGFVLSSYESPEGIGWGRVFNYQVAGIPECEYSHDALNEFLRARGNDELDPSIDPNTIYEGLYAVKPADVKAYIEEKTGMTDVDVLSIYTGMTYVASEDVFFDSCDPFINEDYITCLEGVKSEDKVQLLIQNGNDHKRILTLIATGDSNNPYHFYSCRELWEDDADKVIEAKNYDTGEMIKVAVTKDGDSTIIGIIEGDAPIYERPHAPQPGKTRLQSELKEIAFCDVNGDGFTDMVTVWLYGSQTITVLNQGDGEELSHFYKDNYDVTNWLGKNVSDMTVDNSIQYMLDHQDELKKILEK